MGLADILLSIRPGEPFKKSTTSTKCTKRERLFFWAVGKDHARTVKFLLKAGVDINCKSSTGQTALHIAAARGSLLVTSCLIAKNADMEALTTGGFAPLHIAAAHNQNGAAHLLIEANTAIDVLSSDGYTPLQFAATSRAYRALRVLLENGANVNFQSRVERETALHCAARMGNEKVVLMLLAEGADVGVQDADGVTPLHLAASYCGEGILGVLLRFGASLTVQDKWGFTPVTYLQRREPDEEHLGMLKLFLTAGAWR